MVTSELIIVLFIHAMYQSSSTGSVAISIGRKDIELVFGEAQEQYFKG